MIQDYHNITKGNLDFLKSQTRENLMRAFAGESQARNRYTFAAAHAKKNHLTVISKVFEFTAEQERSHAKVFYDLLGSSAGNSITVDGTYPVDVYPDTLSLLRAARHNEYQEWEHDYADFARTARQEGFDLIGRNFEMIAGIEKTHGDRFALFTELLEQDRLFTAEEDTAWMCLNCGQSIHASMAPDTCPVCRHGQDWFIRLELAPYTAVGR